MVRVAVVGGGVNGVGTALALMRKLPKCQLTLYSADFTPNTTGDGAAGFWGPFISNTDEATLLSWSQETWNLFREWHRSGRDLGVSLVHGVAISREDMPREPWYYIVFGYKDLTQEQLAKYGPEYTSGYSYSNFTAEPSKFLPPMMAEVKDLGGQMVQSRVKSLEGVAASADLVINCSGLGARELVPDSAVYPCRGQVMRVKAPWVGNFLCDESEESFAYILPNTETVVLGGTHQDHDWRTEVDPTDSETIWRNCTSLLPSLKNSEVVREWVGLRPCREAGMRVEADEIKVNNRTVPVVHNYGHGGCGVTTFWGCANAASDIALKLIHRNHGPPSML